jgi:hypothetical protein
MIDNIASNEPADKYRRVMSSPPPDETGAENIPKGERYLTARDDFKLF